MSSERALPGKKRPAKRPEEVAARVAAFVDSPPGGEGVVPLNPGFFRVQRMRMQSVAKKKSDRAVKLRG